MYSLHTCITCIYTYVNYIYTRSHVHLYIHVYVTILYPSFCASWSSLCYVVLHIATNSCRTSFKHGVTLTYAFYTFVLVLGGLMILLPLAIP